MPYKPTFSRGDPALSKRRLPSSLQSRKTTTQHLHLPGTRIYCICELSAYKVAGEHQLVVLFTIASDGCTMGVTEGKLSMSELVGIRERESVRLLLKKQTEQHAVRRAAHHTVKDTLSVQL